MAENKWSILAARLARRSGVPPKFTLEQLKEEFIKYVKFFAEQQQSYTQKSRQKRGGSGDEMQAERVERVSPMTEWSFCVWIGMDRRWLSNTIYDYKQKENRTVDDDEYLDFLERLRTFLNSQLLEGAILGEYTPTIVASLLGLKREIDVTSDGKSAAPVINLVTDNRTREQVHADNSLGVVASAIADDASADRVDVID